MTDEVAAPGAGSTATAEVRERGHIGLIVLASIGAGLVLGLVFVLANRNEFLELRTVFEQSKALRSLGDKPLAVLSADRGQQRGWAAAQDELARLSTNSIHRTAHGSSGTRSGQPLR